MNVPVEELIKERVRVKNDLIDLKRKYEAKQAHYEDTKKRLEEAWDEDS